MIAQTPEPPYYAVIFTSERTALEEGYEETASRMVALAKEQPGFLGMESSRTEIGITVSYWKDLEAIKHWKMNMEHSVARAKGRTDWYSTFKVRIAKVERDYEFEK